MKKLALVAALAAGALVAGAASAATICTGCSYGGNTYLGSHNPTAGDASSYTHTFIPAGGFTDTWLFDIDPAGDLQLHATFIPFSGVLNLDVKLYDVAALCGAAATSCTNVALGNVLATGSPTFSFMFDLGPATVAAGRYAFVVTGDAQAGNSLYSGNLTTAPGTPAPPPSVPEPGSLALVTLAMLGATASRWRRAR